MHLKVTFIAENIPFCMTAWKENQMSLTAKAGTDELIVQVLYDYDDRPLQMQSGIKKDDRVTVILMDHRIELYIHDELMDEEWPAGERLFQLGDPLLGENTAEVTVYQEEKHEVPSVVASFEKAEGWYPGKGVFVGDCMPYRKNDEYHVLYLKDRHHHGSKWGLGAHQWEHISTRDFKTWQVHPMAVPITDPHEGSICTGSWIRRDDQEYLYYTIRRGRGLAAPVCRSVSRDGYHFQKDAAFGFTIAEKYDRARTRDPKVIQSEDGLFHMLLTTRLLQENRGCLAHYVSADLDHWTECPEPIYIAPDAEEPECPDYFKYRGRYYLVFSLGGQARYMISEKPFEGFRMPENPMIPCASVPKCAQWEDRMVFAGFRRMGGYAGSMTFMAAAADETGRLLFEPL